MRILVIDGQGGQLGAQLIKAITARFPDLEIMAVGTNAAATATMLKAGAQHGATGENPVVVACRRADVVIGPVGIVVADSMYGEITPTMATAVGRASAVRILIPVNRCDIQVAGVADLSISTLIADVLEKLGQITEKA